MEDATEIVLSYLRMDDCLSQFELRTISRDYAHPDDTFHRSRFCDVLEVSVHVEDGIDVAFITS